MGDLTNLITTVTKKEEQIRGPNYLEIILFVPSVFRGLHDECGNIANIVVIKTSTESRHGVLSVSYLGNDSFFITSSGKEFLKGLLLESLIRHDDILTSDMTPH